MKMEAGAEIDKYLWEFFAVNMQNKAINSFNFSHVSEKDLIDG